MIIDCIYHHNYLVYLLYCKIIIFYGVNVGKASKLNLVLILVTIISLGIAVGVLIKDRKSENNAIDKEMTVTSEAKSELTNESVGESKAYDTPMSYAEPVTEYQMTAQSNPFNSSLDSPETGEYVKSILLEYFSNKASQARSGTVYDPFHGKLRNLPSTIDYSQYGYGKAHLPPEVEKIIDNSRNFPYETIEPIINNFQFVNCEKGVSNSSKIGYKCRFILPSLDGTGLDTQLNRVPSNFEVYIVQEKIGYTVGYFE